MVITLALETEEARLAADAAAGAGSEVLLVPKLPSGRYARVGTVATIENRGTLPGGTPALVGAATSARGPAPPAGGSRAGNGRSAP